MTPPMLATSDVAKEFGVTDRTVRLWIHRGHLCPDGFTVGGHARFYMKTVVRMQKQLRFALARSRAA